LVHLSVFHFSRKFSKEFGCSPHAFVMKKRVELAVTQISTTLLPIKVIASQCGFADQSHLTRVFRRFVGTTPAALRRLKN